jgi:hypothetical protein
MLKSYLIAAAATVGLISHPARAELPDFDAFFKNVAGCALDIARYDLGARIEGQADAVIMALPNAGSIRGLLITGFFFSPGRGAEEKYGLVFNAPLDVVARTLPELAGRQTVNGHLRSLVRLSDETGESAARRKTLLVCVAGTQT